MEVNNNNYTDELNVFDPAAEQPLMTKIPLKQHQLTLLHRCLMYERGPLDIHTCFPSLQATTQSGDSFRTRIGIIGDRAGAGKSFTVLALICTGKADGGMPIVQTYGMNTVHLSLKDQCQNVDSNLLVVPHNLINQWEEYVETFCPSLRMLVIKSTRALRELQNADLKNIDLIVATSTFYNRVALVSNARNLKYNRAFFDEIDNMNIPGCVKVDASFTWFVTASFGNLMSPRGRGNWNTRLNKHVWTATGVRSMGFVKTLFLDLAYSMTPMMMKMLVVKNNDAFVLNSMSTHDVSYTVVNCRTPNTINLLNGLVDRAIINFLNAGDVPSALNFINAANKDTEENIVMVLIDKYTRTLRVLEARHAYIVGSSRDDDEDDIKRENGHEFSRIAKKQNDTLQTISSIRERITTTNACCICYEDILNKSVVPCCSNSYCLKCISTWLSQKKECPMCKATIRIVDLLVVSKPMEEQVAVLEMNSTSDMNSKSKNMEILIKRRLPSDKILIFSLHDRALTNVGKVLEANEVRYSYLKGNQNQISCTLKAYNDGAIDVILINPLNYGCGVNMEKTTDIIMLHKFDTEIERQVIGRAQRFGRTSILKVWYLLYENEQPV